METEKLELSSIHITVISMKAEKNVKCTLYKAIINNFFFFFFLLVYCIYVWDVGGLYRSLLVCGNTVHGINILMHTQYDTLAKTIYRSCITELQKKTIN